MDSFCQSFSILKNTDIFSIKEYLKEHYQICNNIKNYQQNFHNLLYLLMNKVYL